MQLLQQAIEISRPSRGHRRRAKSVLQSQVPADDPGNKLAQRRIPVGICRTGNGNDGGKLGIAKAGKGACNACQHKAERDRGAGMPRGGLAGEHKNARADDCADAECDQFVALSERRSVFSPSHSPLAKATTWV